MNLSGCILKKKDDAAYNNRLIIQSLVIGASPFFIVIIQINF